ncbi:hypothetical protein BJF96_g1467 [Verticillium dahliae]|uniref:Uncharacterized protein n=1 Tax=Verticillium dahliae TaxID=27337 RepID=A0AA44WR31_VERDA|nr:hypothetical protein BJF96_g1467 [Verticillium dahliae]
MYMPNRAPSGGLWTHRFTSLHLTLFLTRTTIFSALVFPSTAGASYKYTSAATTRPQ